MCIADARRGSRSRRGIRSLGTPGPCAMRSQELYRVRESLVWRSIAFAWNCPRSRRKKWRGFEFGLRKRERTVAFAKKEIYLGQNV